MRLYFHVLVFLSFGVSKEPKPIYTLICRNMCSKIHYMDYDAVDRNVVAPAYTFTLNHARVDVIGFM